MSKLPRHPTQITGSLLQKAEDRLRNQEAEDTLSELSAIADARLLHELQVHQVELELQNEELLAARTAAEKAAADYADLYDFAPVGYISLNQDGNITRANLAGASLLGCERSQLQGKYLRAFVTEASIPEFNTFFLNVFSEDIHPGCEIIIRVNNQLLNVHLDACPSRDGLECLVVLRDTTELKQAQAKLQLAASVFSHARDGIIITDANGCIVKVNDSFTRITGYSQEEVLGKNPRILQSDRQTPLFYSRLWKALLNEGHWSGEIWNRHKNGTLFAEMITISAVCDLKGKTLQYVALFTDITSMKVHQKQLEHMANYDVLTQLPNRMLFADRLKHAMQQCSRRDQMLAVAFLDLDGFKKINDKYDHSVGDDFLITISQRLSEALREGDTLARIGGDEFVAVLVDLEERNDCIPVLDRLLQAASKPVTHGKETMQVSASIGVTMYPQNGSDSDQLLRQADQAMYLAKDEGRNRYQFFDIHSAAAVRNLNQRIQHIQLGIDRGEFVLLYQPKINMKTGLVVGVEALIRWKHPERGLLGPDLFLPSIEGHPISIDLGEWVIETALKQTSEWHSEGLNLPVSVNVGAFQLQDHNFLARLTEMLKAYPEEPRGQLELEILETSALEDVTQVSTLMEACKDLGVDFALDDFGTGYSSLTYLKHLPAASIKIDRSFVRDMLTDSDDLAIVQGVIGLADVFRRQVIAEGVETKAHSTMLMAMGCELAQGYGIAWPMRAANIPGWVTKWEANATWAV
ncbi:sensor domain-containing protein [Alkalimarinus alittae]|uniref:EAL domain-containing protein n=1 Tax=Alkalimarinus alittae TaxID=2961619 RepID=A0ABY6N263_9ALTE|nr:GGDEF and EAL domain-containing protein [Alkalimarinus alittae]UZE96203.1 EAL domain-containing protein [Alkalimarinus alittae]